MRRLVLVVFVFALVLAGSAAGGSPTTPPPEVRPAPLLESAASYVAGKPVRVYCGTDEWDVLLRRLYGARWYLIDGFAKDGGAYLSPATCSALEFKRRGGSNARELPFAMGLLGLVHESMHVRGIVDEGAAECSAVRAVGDVAHRFFGIRKRATMRAFMSNVARAHAAKPPEYRSVC